VEEVFPDAGEVSLAHCGVLFLDELPEFRRAALEVLRQSLWKMAVSRFHARLLKITLPARFMLVAAMNPCPCGHFRRSPKRMSMFPKFIFSAYRIQNFGTSF
jgi:magnesium chelatase family protein